MDANRHLANTAYLDFGGHTRIDFLASLGFDQKYMETHQIGPVVFYEHVYYFREVFPGKPIKVSLDLMGLSSDGMFFEFHHNFYDHTGKNFAHTELMGGWMNLSTRKLIPLPVVLLDRFKEVPKHPDFRILTKQDTRAHAKIPKDLV